MHNGGSTRSIAVTSSLGWAGLLLCAVRLCAADPVLEPDEVIARMSAAYAAVRDYQASMEVVNFRPDASVERQDFLYSFKKPCLIRIDFDSPYHGMVLAYPDREGKVLVRLPGVAHFFPLHLSPDNPRLLVSAGQRIDQTDMGLLISNIAHSLTDERRGEISITEDASSVRIRVLAVNHFRKDLLTLYLFSIGKTLFLPERIEESTPGGRLERSLTFRGLRVNTGLSDRFFYEG